MKNLTACMDWLRAFSLEEGRVGEVLLETVGDLDKMRAVLEMYLDAVRADLRDASNDAA